MDDIMEKNLRTFADWFMKQQQDYAEKIEEVEVLKEQIEDMASLIDMAWMLIFNVKEWAMTDTEKVEKIGHAINMLYDRWNVWEQTDLDYNE